MAQRSQRFFDFDFSYRRFISLLRMSRIRKSFPACQLFLLFAQFPAGVSRSFDLLDFIFFIPSLSLETYPLFSIFLK